MKSFLPSLGLFLLIFNPFVNSAQDLKVPIEWLEFSNAFEENSFQAAAGGDTNHLFLLLAAAGRMDSSTALANQGKLEQIFLSLDSAKLVRKSTKKIVKTVFNTVHEQIFYKYELNNQFCEVFETGFYNCVSASGMYSYFFARLGILHMMVQIPGHVYVMVMHDDETWVVESTDPQQGFYEIEMQSREETIQEYLAQKLISPEQLNDPKLDSILGSFDDREFVSASRLVAIQYQNQSLYDLEAEKFHSALQNHLKARFLAPKADYEEAAFIIGTWVEKQDYSKPYYFDLCRVNWTFFSEKEKLENLEAFEYYGSLYLENKIDRSIYDAWFDSFKEAFADNDSALKYIRANRYTILGTEAFQNGKISETLQNGKNCLAEIPNDQNGLALVITGIGMKIQAGKWTESIIADSLRYYNNNYPSLMEKPVYRNLVAEVYILEAVNHVNRNQLSSAKRNLEELEEILGGSLPETINEERVALAYSKVAHYSFRSSKKEAQNWIERGLKYAPSNSLLLGLKDYYRKI
tara:strand:+ start:71 stop:1633 length:1563 start_codon:yes stop_codon:yes gene_type:complete